MSLRQIKYIMALAHPCFIITLEIYEDIKNANIMGFFCEFFKAYP